MSGIIETLSKVFGEKKAFEIAGAAYEGPERYNSRSQQEKDVIKKSTIEFGPQATAEGLAAVKGDVKNLVNEVVVSNAEKALLTQAEAGPAVDKLSKDNPGKTHLDLSEMVAFKGMSYNSETKIGGANLDFSKDNTKLHTNDGVVAPSGPAKGA